MEKRYITIEKKNTINQINKKQDAKRSLGNYINQLKMHFELSDEDIVEIVKSVVGPKLQKNKKWWQL